MFAKSGRVVKWPHVISRWLFSVVSNGGVTGFVDFLKCTRLCDLKLSALDLTRDQGQRRKNDQNKTNIVTSLVRQSAGSFSGRCLCESQVARSGDGVRWWYRGRQCGWPSSGREGRAREFVNTSAQIGLVDYYCLELTWRPFLKALIPLTWAVTKTNMD